VDVNRGRQPESSSRTVSRTGSSLETCAGAEQTRSNGLKSTFRKAVRKGSCTTTVRSRLANRSTRSKLLDSGLLRPFARQKGTLNLDATNCQSNDPAGSTYQSAERSGAKPDLAAAWKWITPLLAVMAVPMFLERFGVVPISKLEFVGDHRPPGSDWPWLGVVATQAILGGCLLAIFWREYTRSLVWRVSWWTVPLGLLGLLAWVVICELGWEHAIYQLLPGDGAKAVARSSVNPGEAFPEPSAYVLFLVARFVVLVLVIPIAEELLLRGFLLRMMQRDDWWAMPMRELSWTSIGISAAYGALTHPNEIFAAIVWFAAVTWWVRWTNRFWDGVLIHAITNATLGIYVLSYQQWHLW
jgi:uncharacterized protein